MNNKKVLIDAIRNLSNPKKPNKNKNYFDLDSSAKDDFISAKNGVDTPIYKKVSVKPSPIAGRGLFAEQSIRAGEPIGISHIRKKFMRDGEEYQAPFPSTTLGYYNHSKEPNVYEVDKGGHIVMVAGRDINPGDEITANYDQNEIEDLEGSSDFKRGGSTRKAKIPNRKSPKSYSRSLEATNKFFREHSFFEKPKKLSKKRIYDPNAKYFKDGGENECPKGYIKDNNGNCVWHDSDQENSIIDKSAIHPVEYSRSQLTMGDPFYNTHTVALNDKDQATWQLKNEDQIKTNLRNTTLKNFIQRHPMDSSGLELGYLHNNIWTSPTLGLEKDTFESGYAPNQLRFERDGKHPNVYFIKNDVKGSAEAPSSTYPRAFQDYVNKDLSKDNAYNRVSNDLGRSLLKKGYKGENMWGKDDEDQLIQLYGTEGSTLKGATEITPETLKYLQSIKDSEEGKRHLAKLAGISEDDPDYADMLMHYNTTPIDVYADSARPANEDLIRLEKDNEEQSNVLRNTEGPVNYQDGGLIQYAPGGWPPKGLRKFSKPTEIRSNKITIGNAKDFATNSSAAQAISALKDRTVNLWNTPEGQRRLQNLINTTPSLQANLFFDSKDMVSDLANTRNMNQEIIDYEALMDNIINEQNQVDSYYDQNLMTKNDHFNTSVDLDTKLKKAEEEYAQLLEHAKTKGGAFYDRNESAFVINPKYFNNAALPKVAMHEVIHLPGLKRGVGRTSIDEKLGGLELKDQLDFDFSNANNNNSFYKHLNRNGNYLGGAKSYYDSNGGFERSPFLAELREDMLQNNIIKHPYQKVNSKMIKDYYTDYLKKEDKYPLRIFDIMTNKPKNFSLLSNTMNELPSFAPYVIGAGAATLLDNPFSAESNTEDGKYAGGGEPCPDGYIRSTATGECVLDVSAEQTPAEEWYKNWYTNRVIQDVEGQKLLNEARPKLLKRTEKFPEVDYDTKGLGDSSGMYNPMTGKISLNSSQMTSPFIRDEVLFHEKGHYLTSPSMLDPEMDTYKEMKNHPVHKLREYETGLVNEALVPKNKVSKEEGKFYDYISGNYGEEMSKRIMELRRLAGFKPDQEITDNDLKNFYQKAKIKGWTDPNSDAFVPALIDFQRFINSPQDLKMLLNKMAKNESEPVDEYAPQQAQYGGSLPKAKMGWPPKGLKRTSGSYKAPNINFNKTVPTYIPNPIKKTLRDVNIETLGTLNAIAKGVVPTKVNPMQVLTLGHPIEGVGPFTGSPLNSIPFYGTKLPEDPKAPVAGVAFRKFGDTLDWVKNTGELNPAHGSALRFGKDQISKKGNWSEMGWANEKYPGVFAAGFDSHVPGSNLKINNLNDRNGVVVTEGDNPAISIMDPGVRLHRRLPFSNRYVDINMDKLRNDQFDWRTMGGNVQSLIERYGYTAGYAVLLSALGLPALQDKIDEYINEPIIRSYKEYIDPLFNPKEEDGGEVDYELGQEIDKATMEKLKKLGYTFQKIK